MRNLIAARPSRRMQRGFSLVEALVSSIIFVALMVAVHLALSSAMRVEDIQGTYIKIQADGRRALEKMAAELRMTGRFDNPALGQPGYPYVFADSDPFGVFTYLKHDPPARHLPAGNPANGATSEIVFRIPRDEDGDGLLTEAATGNIEWCDEDVSYSLVTDPNGINVLERRENGATTDILARYVERITFGTIDTDPAVDMNEVVITLYMAREAPRGVWLQTNLTTCVTMRNTEEVH